MNYARKKTVIFDTSTLIGVFLKPKQLPARVFFHAAEHYRIITSPETKAELVEVVQRDKFDRFRCREERLQQLWHYLGIVEEILPHCLVTDCRDPKDNKFLSLALSAQADFMVSSDDDLLVLNPYHNTTILSVRDYAELHGTE